MSDANRVNFAYKTYKDSDQTYGVVPVSAPTLKDFLRISDSFGQNPSTMESTTLRSDQMRQDILRKNIAPAGDVAFNLCYGGPDDLISALLGSAWGADVNLSGDIQCVDSGNKFQSNSTTTGPSFASIVVGQWIKVAGMTASNNNGYFKVISKDISNTAAEVIGVAGTAITDATAHAGTIKGSLIQNGTDKYWCIIEKAYLDLSNIFDSFLGVRVESMALNIKTADAISGSFKFQGQSAAGTGTATLGNGSNTAAPTTQELNSNDHVTSVYMDNALATFSAAELSFTFQKGMRQKGKINLFGPFDIGVGVITCKGTLNCYFEDRTLLNKARSFDEVGFAVQMVDDAGNCYIIDIPAARISGGDPVITGIDTDVMSNFTFDAKIDSVSGKMFSISKFAV